MVLGDPVTGKEFFDRNKQTAILFSTLEDYKKGKKRNIAIIGLRKIGKTSLMKEFIRRLHKSNHGILCLDVYLPENDIQGFFTSCIRGIAIELLRIMNVPAKAITLGDALKIVSQTYSKTSVGINNLIEFVGQKKYDDAFNYLFEIFDIVKAETDNCVIVFLDEFQRLQEYGSSIVSPIDKFRQSVMNQKDILYIISGSAVGMLNKLISSSKSPLFGHFETMQLRGFDFADASQFILEKKEKTLSISQDNIAFLFEITNGNPFYLDILMHSIERNCKLNGYSRVSNEVLEQALIDEIFQSNGSIYQYFNSLIEQSLEKGGSIKYTKIIKGIAFGNRRPSQIAKYTNINLTTLPPYLKRLIELEIVHRSNATKKNARVAEYELVDTLFELWLKQVYSLKEDALLRDLSSKMAVFKKQMSNIIADYTTQLGKGDEARIRELFSSFDNDHAYGLIIPKFDKIERKTLSLNREIDAYCHNKEGVWVVEVTKTRINKAEINNIMDKVKEIKVDKQVENVIVISLRGIEEDALELCQKYGFKVWGIEEVNKLMKRKGMFKILI